MKKASAAPALVLTLGLFVMPPACIAVDALVGAVARFVPAAADGLYAGAAKAHADGDKGGVIAMPKAYGYGDFAEMMTNRTGHLLDDWIAAATDEAFPALRSFARGLQADYAAVRNGLTTEFSSGAVEGNVTRIKALKRQMYGRAKFDLLRKRVLLTP